MTFLKLFTTIIGIMMSVGYFPQAWKIYKTKDVSSISIPTFVIFALGTLTWAIYGFVIGDSALIASFIVGVVGSWSILGLTLLYTYRKGK
jgi:MtN3 and saliva related transmembrane protein